MNDMLETWARDLKHATRSLVRAPVFAVVTVVTLALAIGSNTAIFSVVDAVLLDPLPFPNADRLVLITGVAPGSDREGEVGVSDELYVEYRENAAGLEDAGYFARWWSTFRVEEHTERLLSILATPPFFTTLGVRPMLGRLPTLDDDGRVIVISHWLWTEWFGADPAVLDRSYEFGGELRTVIGVMGPEFRFPDERVALWIPWDIEPVEPGDFGAPMIGRMAPGTDPAGLAVQLAPLARRLPEQYGGSAEYARFMEQYRPVVRPLKEELVGAVAGPLWILTATVGIVLLMACANIANLFMVRAESRRQDLAVRRALGAGRAGLIRSQMAEALLLAAVGGIGGALIAWAGVPLLVRAAPDGIGNIGIPIAGLTAAGVDLTALFFTAGVSLLAACVFGLLPAIRFSGSGLLGNLRQAGRGTVGRRHVGRDVLVVFQTASALVLLIGSALLVRSFVQLTRVDPGYDTEDIFTFQVSPDREELNDGPSYARFHYGLMERLAAMPTVESVGLVNMLPLDEGAGDATFVTDRSEVSGAEALRLNFTFMGGDYFQTMGIDLLTGRDFDVSDHISGSASAIVSRSTAEQLWPGEDPTGRRLRLSDVDTWWTVIGVVEDVLLEDFRQQSTDPMVYLPMTGPTPELYAIGSPAYVVRSARANVIAPEIRALVREIAPEAPMYRVFTMEYLANRSMVRLSFTMLMLAITAGLALVLGAVGIYGVLSYVVSQRAREIAVRMALGAHAPGVRRMVVLQGGRVALMGVVLGILAALGVTRFLESLLFGVQTIDGFAFVGTSSLMLAVALLASYVPARRASAVDPIQSLRTE